MTNVEKLMTRNVYLIVIGQKCTFLLNKIINLFV